MNVAEWILVCILSFTLFVFLIVGIIFLIKLMGLIKEAKKITVTAQSIAQKADDVAGNVKSITDQAENAVTNARRMSNLANLANLIKKRYNAGKASKKGKE